MRNRQNTLLWMKDLIEHMTACQEQLHFASDGPAESFLADSLMADLTEFRHLCEQIRSRPRKGTGPGSASGSGSGSISGSMVASA